MMGDRFNPFQFMITQKALEDEGDKRRSSSWLIAPYFMLYFVTFVVNFLVWPLLVMERLCAEAYDLKEIYIFRLNLTSGTCIDRFLNGSGNNSVQSIINQVNNDTLNLMIISSVATAFFSLASYFLIWRPTLANCKFVAVFLPPICTLCQCILFAYGLSINDTKVFKYLMIAAGVMPALHCNFQGVFMLYYDITNKEEKFNFKLKRDIANTKIELTHALVFVAVAVAGFAIGSSFDMSYSLIFVMQFTLAFLNLLYAVIIAPTSLNCFSKKKTDDEEDNNTKSKDDESVVSSEEESELLTHRAKNSRDKGLLSNESNLFSEAPMIFSETSHRKELIVIIELSIFTIAIISDGNISGLYFLQAPFNLTLREYGYCIAAQAVAKTIGLLLMKILVYFKPMRHSTLISLAAFNYVFYYTVLAVIPSKNYVFIALLANFFGGIAIPALISFMKINFPETIETVLEISVVSSLITNVGFSSIEYYVYMKTRNIFPGIIFLMTAAMIVLGFVVVIATFFSTTVKNKRRTKEYADQLLNDFQ